MKMTFYSNQKQKSYVLNPRGKPLYEDSNRFGTKMLEKMGWSKGKGLGANLDGEQNFIRVSHKVDQKGMGFKDRDDHWTVHENDFNSLLKSLDNSPAPSDKEEDDKSSDEAACVGFGFTVTPKADKKRKSIKASLSGKSLEQMSKSSGARVHYRKFTRGKDISRYSEKDLANIFGKKLSSPNETVEPVQTEEVAEDNFNYGITTIESGTTIGEYFHKKSKSKKRKNENEEEPDHDEKLNKLDETADDDMSDMAVPVKEKKEKKKNKKKAKPSEPTENTTADLGNDADVDGSPKEKKKKKSKKSKTEKVIDLDSSVELVEKPTKTKNRSKKSLNEAAADEITTESTPNVTRTFIENILMLANNSTNCSSVENVIADSGSGVDTTEATSAQNISRLSERIALETFEINRYQAEMFRFVDLDGFGGANLGNLSGYGFSKNIDLQITAKTRDESKISDLWDHALINKYGKDAVRTKKNKKYSIKTLKKKSLFKPL